MSHVIKIGEVTIIMSPSGEITAFTSLTTDKNLTKEQTLELGKLIANFIMEIK